MKDTKQIGSQTENIIREEEIIGESSNEQTYYYNPDMDHDDSIMSFDDLLGDDYIFFE